LIQYSELLVGDHKHFSEALEDLLNLFFQREREKEKQKKVITNYVVHFIDVYHPQLLWSMRATVTIRRTIK
jgi:hypothetical protein